ncbi:MAG: hypothetical protein K1X35_10910 [Caulobacteraceae bacterium]|nr:hypothetical protein [Caulobacteraceae bacterium]
MRTAIFQQLVGVFAATLLAASPALAKPDVDCLWDQLTPAQQASRIPPRPNGDMAPPIEDLTAAQEQAMQTRCGLSLDTEAQWLASIDMLGAERGLVAWLDREAGLPSSRLEAAWNGMAPVDMEVLKQSARAAILGTDKPEDAARVDAVSQRFAAGLGFQPGTDAYSVAAIFVSVRALRLALIEVTPT